MGYSAAALKGGYHDWTSRYPVEPKSAPVVLNAEPADGKSSDDYRAAMQITPAMEHLLAAKHMFGRRPAASLTDNKSPVEKPGVDGKADSEHEMPADEPEPPPDHPVV